MPVITVAPGMSREKSMSGFQEKLDELTKRADELKQSVAAARADAAKQVAHTDAIIEDKKAEIRGKIDALKGSMDLKAAQVKAGAATKRAEDKALAAFSAFVEAEEAIIDAVVAQAYAEQLERGQG